ncbi:MAG: cation:proton antiporter [Chthoniobacterales bacterium]
MRRHTIGYLAIIGISILLIGVLLHFGERDMPSPSTAASAAHATTVGTSLDLFITSLKANFHHPVAILFLQITIILIAARLAGALFTYFGQPAVIGEVIAGIVLGPSLLGGIFPSFLTTCFPPDSLPRLQLFSQFGLVLFMFIIGMELNLDTVRKKAAAAVMISHVGIVAPFLLGVGASIGLFRYYASPTVGFTAFALFMGVAMSITAFPVLARIINERGLSASPLGSLVLTCAAADDITAWCLLAAVVAYVKMGTAVQTIYLLIALGLFALIMIRVVRPVIARWGEKFSESNPPGRNAMAVIFSLLFISAFFTDLVGIHALFGGFLMGAIMPEGAVRLLIMEKIRDLSMLVLLPIFFMISGLRTQFGLLNSGTDWLFCALIIFVAIAGKFGGTLFAARFAGQSWRDSSVIGVLMNTRGLVELIVLNIGYEMHILEPRIFSMMVIMALVTTCIAGPYLSLLDWYEKKRLRSGVVNPVTS